MPRARSPNDEVTQKYGNKYGFLNKYNRLYIRSDKQFKPFGWKLEFTKFIRKNNTFDTENTTLVVSDDEIGYIS